MEDASTLKKMNMTGDELEFRLILMVPAPIQLCWGFFSTNPLLLIIFDGR